MNQPDLPAAIANIIESSPTPDILFAQGYEKPDGNGQYTPFCAAISYFFKNYF
jgi:hypothetical protein